MIVQAINTSMGINGCQPLKQVDFARSKKPPVVEEEKPQPEDKFTPSDSSTMEQKYNLACRIAAYYKTQYDNLLKNGECIA